MKTQNREAIIALPIWATDGAFFASVLLSIALLVISVTSRQQIGFYSLLRFAVCATCIIGAKRAFCYERSSMAFCMVAGAVLFNPLLPFHLGRGTWEVVDKAAIPALVIGAALLWRGGKSHEAETL